MIYKVIMFSNGSYFGGFDGKGILTECKDVLQAKMFSTRCEEEKELNEAIGSLSGLYHIECSVMLFSYTLEHE